MRDDLTALRTYNLDGIRELLVKIIRDRPRRESEEKNCGCGSLESLHDRGCHWRCGVEAGPVVDAVG